MSTIKLALLATTVTLIVTGCAGAGAATAPRKAAPAEQATGSSGPGRAPLTPLLPGAACPKGNGGTAIIDYIDFINFQGRTYIAQMGWPAYNLPTAALGEQVGTSRCELSTIQPAPDYANQAGDTGFLPAGTAIHAVGGYPTTFRLAALREGHYRIYEVDTAPAARTGGELLPLTGLVRSIEIIDSDTQASVLGRVTDSREVASLVAMIVAAPVDQARRMDETRYSLRLRLADGSTVLRVWTPKQSIVARGIVVPAAFNRGLQRHLASR